MEYLDAKRIRNIIAGLQKKQNQQFSATSQSLAEDDAIENDLEDICDFIFNYCDESQTFWVLILMKFNKKYLICY